MRAVKDESIPIRPLDVIPVDLQVISHNPLVRKEDTHRYAVIVNICLRSMA